MNGSRLDPLSAADRDSTYLGPDGEPVSTFDLENTDFGIHTHPDEDIVNSSNEIVAHSSGKQRL